MPTFSRDWPATARSVRMDKIITRNLTVTRDLRQARPPHSPAGSKPGSSSGGLSSRVMPARVRPIGGGFPRPPLVSSEVPIGRGSPPGRPATIMAPSPIIVPLPGSLEAGRSLPPAGLAVASLAQSSPRPVVGPSARPPRRSARIEPVPAGRECPMPRRRDALFAMAALLAATMTRDASARQPARARAGARENAGVGCGLRARDGITEGALIEHRVGGRLRSPAQAGSSWPGAATWPTPRPGSPSPGDPLLHPLRLEVEGRRRGGSRGRRRRDRAGGGERTKVGRDTPCPPHLL